MSAFLDYVPSPGAPFDSADVVGACFEHGCQAVLLDQSALPPEFFDLSSGVAGELAHRVTLYGIRLAAVVPNAADYSAAFQAFVREANRGHALRFLATRDQAAAWLEEIPAATR